MQYDEYPLPEGTLEAYNRLRVARDASGFDMQYFDEYFLAMIDPRVSPDRMEAIFEKATGRKHGGGSSSLIDRLRNLIRGDGDDTVVSGVIGPFSTDTPLDEIAQALRDVMQDDSDDPNDHNHGPHCVIEAEILRRASELYGEGLPDAPEEIREQARQFLKRHGEPRRLEIPDHIKQLMEMVGYDPLSVHSNLGVGQRVRILPREPEWEDEGPGYSPQMTLWSNMEAKVVAALVNPNDEDEVLVTLDVDNQTHIWFEHWLEPIESNDPEVDERLSGLDFSFLEDDDDNETD